MRTLAVTKRFERGEECIEGCLQRSVGMFEQLCDEPVRAKPLAIRTNGFVHAVGVEIKAVASREGNDMVFERVTNADGRRVAIEHLRRRFARDENRPGM